MRSLIESGRKNSGPRILLTDLLGLLAVVTLLAQLDATLASAETLVLDDTNTVFDGSMFGGNGCDGEFPMSSCKYYNFGGFSTFDVGKNLTHGSTEWRSLMGFDFSGLPDQSQIMIDSAILTLTACIATEPDSVLHIGFRSLKHDVIEGNAQTYGNATDSSFTWAARIFKDNADTVDWQIPGAGGGEDREDSIFAISPGIEYAAEYRVNLTELMQYWMDSTATCRWCLLSDTASNAKPYARKLFWSSECSTPSQRPKLEIFYRCMTGRQRGNILKGGLLK